MAALKFQALNFESFFSLRVMHALARKIHTHTYEESYHISSRFVLT